LWGKVKVGNGVTFVDPIDVPTVYMFLIYCGKNEIPEENTIIKHVSEARVIRLQGEELLKQAKAENDPLLIKNANKTIENAWEKMRDEENFGTVFISAIHPDHPGLALYRGLPLNYVALEDAKKIADQSLGNQSNQLRRYIFVGLFDYCVEFESNGNKVL
jgi:hypothetical protein